MVLRILNLVMTLLLSPWHLYCVTIVNIIIRENPLLAPLLNFLLDFISLVVENFSDDSVTMSEFLTPLPFQSRILSDEFQPLGVDDGLQLFLVKKTCVCLQGRKLSPRSFCEVEWFISDRRNGHTTSVVVEPLSEPL